MCYTCGCKLPFEDHGDSHNIIEDHLDKSGQTEAIKKAGRKTAKENMLELFKLQEESNELAKPKRKYT